MKPEEILELAKDAISHTLRAICADPAKYYLMGGRFNGSYQKLITAHGALHQVDVEKLFAGFQPNEEHYNRWLDEREANERLLTHCRESGITVDGD